MKIAIIDLGTNTFNLLICECKGSDYNIITESRCASKIGKGGINDNTITPEAIQRGLDALQTHLNTISEYGIDQIFCFATAAIRSASNGKHFVDLVKEKLNLDINVITGDKEAELIFDGVKQVSPIDDRNVLIVDIGGGSTECIIANKDGIKWKHSFNIGAARMLDYIKPADPINNDNLSLLDKYFDKHLSELFTHIKRFLPTKLIGSSGSFDTLASMVAHRQYPNINHNKLTSFEIEYDKYLDLHDTLKTSTYKERLDMPKLENHRADVIVLASCLIKYICEKADIKTIYQSSFALKEGAIYRVVNKQTI